MEFSYFSAASTRDLCTRLRRILSTTAKVAIGSENKIYIILHIIRKPNSIIVLIFNQNIFSS